MTGLCSGAELRELESNEGVMFGRGERGGLSDTVMTSKGLQEAREQVRQHVSVQPERNVTDVRQEGPHQELRSALRKLAAEVPHALRSSSLP